jgi:hypothetical protein
MLENFCESKNKAVYLGIPSTMRTPRPSRFTVETANSRQDRNKYIAAYAMLCHAFTPEVGLGYV